MRRAGTLRRAPASIARSRIAPCAAASGMTGGTEERAGANLTRKARAHHAQDTASGWHDRKCRSAMNSSRAWSRSLRASAARISSLQHLLDLLAPRAPGGSGTARARPRRSPGYAHAPRSPAPRPRRGRTWRCSLASVIMGAFPELITYSMRLPPDVRARSGIDATSMHAPQPAARTGVELTDGENLTSTDAAIPRTPPRQARGRTRTRGCAWHSRRARRRASRCGRRPRGTGCAAPGSPECGRASRAGRDAARSSAGPREMARSRSTSERAASAPLPVSSSAPMTIRSGTSWSSALKSPATAISLWASASSICSSSSRSSSAWPARRSAERKVPSAQPPTDFHTNGSSFWPGTLAASGARKCTLTTASTLAAGQLDIGDEDGRDRTGSAAARPRPATPSSAGGAAGPRARAAARAGRIWDSARA